MPEKRIRRGFSLSAFFLAGSARTLYKIGAESIAKNGPAETADVFCSRRHEGLRKAHPNKERWRAK